MVENGRIFSQFSEQNIILREEWLEKQLSKNIDDVFHNFLFEDISISAEGSLPPNAQTLHNITLKGVFILQVHACEDVSQSQKQRREAAMEFVEKIDTTKKRNNNTDNFNNLNINKNANLNRSNRMLKIVLTDGRQQIAAFEYRKFECNILTAALDTLKKVCDTNLVLNNQNSIAANRKFEFKTYVSKPKVVVCGDPVFKNGILFLQACNIKLLWPGMVVDCS